MSRHVIIDSSGENIAKDMWERNTRPSELELRIRRDVMDDLVSLESGVLEIEANGIGAGNMYDTIQRIKDKLKLLWGEQ